MQQENKKALRDFSVSGVAPDKISIAGRFSIIRVIVNSCNATLCYLGWRGRAGFFKFTKKKSPCWWLWSRAGVSIFKMRSRLTRADRRTHYKQQDISLYRVCLLSPEEQLRIQNKYSEPLWISLFEPRSQIYEDYWSAPTGIPKNKPPKDT